MAVSKSGSRNAHFKRLKKLCPAFQSHCYSKVPRHRLKSVHRKATVHKKTLVIRVESDQYLG